MAEANETDQNDCPIVIKFGYTNYKVDETTKVASANCKKCRALIKEKAGTTSAFIRHLSVSTHDYLRGEWVYIFFEFFWYIDKVVQSTFKLEHIIVSKTC